MTDKDLLKQRLGQYAVVWIATFAIVLVGALGAALGFHQRLVSVSDVLLPAAFAVLGLIGVLFALHTLVAPARAWIKAALLALGVLLALPMLWSPVLAVLVVATVSHATIEYSTAYAQFRILVSDLLYPPTAFLFRGSVVHGVWTGFKVAATIVGFISTVSQLWPMMRRTPGRSSGNR